MSMAARYVNTMIDKHIVIPIMDRLIVEGGSIREVLAGEKDA